MEEYNGPHRLASFIRFDQSQAYPRTTMSSPPSTKNSARFIRKPIKRKQESVIIVPSYVESCLVKLCRGQRWEEVIRRCQWYPDEADLVPISIENPEYNNVLHRHSIKRAVIKSINSGDHDGPVFRETALGIVCASKDIGTEEVKAVVKALIDANPNQVGASQLISGHTPIRDAILNDRCTGQILGIIMDATSRYADGAAALRFKDRNGLSLIDHLVTSVQLDSSFCSIEMIEKFVLTKPFKFQSSENHASPLIRLLTMGNSSHSVSTSDKMLKSSLWRKNQRLDNENSRFQRVLKVTKLLLDDDPNLLHQSSRLTGCAPLHVALRNYGNFEPLIQELLIRDSSNDMMKVRNSYGDLPLHVACSVGVPLHVLGMIVERTVSVTRNSSLEEDEGRSPAIIGNPLIWSVNNSGYTPVDLEWVRHIESGSGSFYTARTFYPLEATGVRRHCFKQDEYYTELLKESVDQVMKNYPSAITGDESKVDSREEEAKETFGCLIDRISLLIRAAASTESVLGTEVSTPARLADACSLCAPYSPTLPLPILELFLWLRPEEVMEKGERGMLPIHHALCGSMTQSYTSSSSPSIINQWRSFVFKLLDTCAEQCRVKCQAVRLPLHYVLDHSSGCGDNSEQKNPSGKEMQTSRHAIVEKLIELYPECVDQRDPVTGLYPFMMASMDQNISIDTIFCLLRRSPSRCPAAISTARTV